MVDIQVGQRYKDNDPRMDGRILTVIGFDNQPRPPYRTRAICTDSAGRTVRIDTQRMHISEKSRRSGFSLLRM